MEIRKILSAITIFLSLFQASSFSQTSIPGGAVSGTWTKAGSPYNIQGSIQILNNTILTIQPGATVNFQGTYQLLVLGRLLAVGNINDTIHFTATDTTAGWYGIRFDNTPATNDTSKISYCRIKYGKATGPSPLNKGGALYFNNFSKAIISNCMIARCTAIKGGGGIYCSSSSPIIINNNISNNYLTSSGEKGAAISINSNSIPVISNNIISNNSTTSGGGSGVFIMASNPAISFNTIKYNYTTGMGGGIYIMECNPNIHHNTISNNVAFVGGGVVFDNPSGTNTPSFSNNIVSNNTVSNTGGGITCFGKATINNNTIINNSAAGYAGGVEFQYSTVTLSNNIISNNTVGQPKYKYSGGGGIWCVGISTTTSIVNNIIINNTGDNGAGILLSNSTPVITNNTISNNSSRVSGGALYFTGGSSPTLNNCILWGNSADSSGVQVSIFDQLSAPNFYYCDVQGSSAAFAFNNNFYNGTYSNNINSDPLFVSPSGGSGAGNNGITANWNLQPGSPCINSGNPSGSYPSNDIAANPRIAGGRIDMGAYEFQGPTGIPNNSLDHKLNLFPNPASTFVTIETAQPNMRNIQLLNLLGQSILNEIIAATGKATLDISSLPKGIYIVQLHDSKTRMIDWQKLEIQ